MAIINTKKSLSKGDVKSNKVFGTYWLEVFKIFGNEVISGTIWRGAILRLNRKDRLIQIWR